MEAAVAKQYIDWMLKNSSFLQPDDVEFINDIQEVLRFGSISFRQSERLERLWNRFCKQYVEKS